ncbi:hypothetical protein EV144_10240 [Flavobacterium sp. 270]|uniref:hypothetical protein n=1 Tax=Flavobacterium sp. 270 TaxID=2512114 RepID=UPI001066169D|nr:hypothetical protein [Flavobacterium sp. 270]TDW49624.1 hypothetical protein EV144_10240 [Flavobacterium sp. 270]
MKNYKIYFSILILYCFTACTENIKKQVKDTTEGITNKVVTISESTAATVSGYKNAIVKK